MMVVREPVTAEVVAAVAIATAATVEGWSGSEAAAAKMHTASTVTAAAKMHAASTVAAAAKMHATSAVATTAKVTASSTTTMAVHLRGQTFRDLPGHTRVARVDQ
jgi:hypothetical protein